MSISVGNKGFQESFVVYAGFAIILMAMLIYLIVSCAIVIYILYTSSSSLLNGHNNFRNFLELCYFITNSLVALSVWVALVLTGRQFTEAKNARLAGVYTGLEARWSSESMINSRNNIEKLYNEAIEKNVVIHEYFRTKLIELKTQNYPTYISIMSLADFLEYVGMLEHQGYLAIRDIEPLIGKVAVFTGAYLSAHIIDLRQESAKINAASGYAKMPVDYAYFSKLMRRFQSQFGYQPS